MRKAAMVAYGVIVCELFVAGVVLVFRSEFLPYHAKVVGMEWQAVPINMQLLILSMMHMVGALYLGVGLALAAMLTVPFRRGELWADWIIPVVLFLWQSAGLVEYLEFAAKTGAHPPLQVFVSGFVITLVGAVLCFLARHRKG
jgi:hypothetical protein